MDAILPCQGICDSLQEGFNTFHRAGVMGSAVLYRCECGGRNMVRRGEIGITAGQGDKCSGAKMRDLIRQLVPDPKTRAKIFSGNAKRLIKGLG